MKTSAAPVMVLFSLLTMTGTAQAAVLTVTNVLPPGEPYWREQINDGRQWDRTFVFKTPPYHVGHDLNPEVDDGAIVNGDVNPGYANLLKDASTWGFMRKRTMTFTTVITIDEHIVTLSTTSTISRFAGIWSATDCHRYTIQPPIGEPGKWHSLGIDAECGFGIMRIRMEENIQHRLNWTNDAASAYFRGIASGPWKVRMADLHYDNGTRYDGIWTDRTTSVRIQGTASEPGTTALIYYRFITRGEYDDAWTTVKDVDPVCESWFKTRCNTLSGWVEQAFEKAGIFLIYVFRAAPGGEAIAILGLSLLGVLIGIPLFIGALWLSAPGRFTIYILWYATLLGLIAFAWTGRAEYITKLPIAAGKTIGALAVKAGQAAQRAGIWVVDLIVRIVRGA